MIPPPTERTLGPRVQQLLHDLVDRFDRRRVDVLALRTARRKQLQAGDVDLLADTEHVRRTAWRVDPLPPELMERRVEFLGGSLRSDLIHGLNAGAKSYIADLWNFTTNDTWSIVRAHRALERAARMDLAYLDPVEGRVRANPNSPTRLMVAPRPLWVLESSVLEGDEPVPASFFDLAMLRVHVLPALKERQGGLYLVLRDVHGHLEARLWSQLFDALEQDADLPRGSIRATVMIDSIAGALEMDEILFELMHHAAGISIDPQAYAADHIALFHGPDVPVFPDRETIGLNASFLRALSLHSIGIAHKRGCHAIGPASFILPSRDPLMLKKEYLEMLADKEREALDGCDGTLVIHAGTINAAMAEFNKVMPRAHQMDYLREDDIRPVDLIERPTGVITVESLVSCIRTIIRSLVQRAQGNAHVVQGGRSHDRSSLRLALRLLWQWNHSRHGVVTATKLEIHEALLRYLVKKEADKMYADADDHTKTLAKRAVQLTLDSVLSENVPLEPQV
ncbi:MAG: hypothetical protein IPP83_02845 [Flavobacteriales bacterium]|nr:hypothetical protein [Flavobacteriales bacterium]